MVSKAALLVGGATVAAAVGTAACLHYSRPEPVLKGDIMGRVIDAATSLPVSGALVKVGAKRTYTDADGLWFIGDLDAGDVTIEISAADYVTFTGTNTVVEGETVDSGDIILVPVVQPTDVVAAIIAVPTIGDIPLVVDITVIGSGGVGPYDFEIDFADGSTTKLYGITQTTVRHTYAAAGSYNVSVKVIDRNDDFDVATVLITANAPPEALNVNLFGPYPETGVVGEAVNFEVHVTGGVRPYTYYWNFGDGQSSVYQNPAWYPVAIGYYMVSLTVRDAENNSVTKFVGVNVYLNPQYFINTLEYLRTQGGWSGFQNLGTAVMDIDLLRGVPINPQELIDILNNSIQLWAAPPSNYYWSTRVWWALNTYRALGATPADNTSRIDSLFADIDTWAKAVADTEIWSPHNTVGSMWAKQYSWQIYYGSPVPWLEDYFSYSYNNQDAWMPYLHNRAHNFITYVQHNREFPSKLQAVELTLSEQRSDGTWTDTSTVEVETVTAAFLLRMLAAETGKVSEVEAALTRTRNWLLPRYREVELIPGVMSAGFTQVGGNTIDGYSTLNLIPLAGVLELVPAKNMFEAI